MRTRSAGGSAAYALSRFTPARQEARRPRLTVASPSARARARARAAYALKVAAVALAMAAVVAALLYSHAVLSELKSEASSMQNDLRDLHSEQVRLSAELESKISLRNVEDYAAQLGMAPLDKSQITYVDLSRGDRIELSAESPKQTLGERLRLAMSNVRALLQQD